MRMPLSRIRKYSSLMWLLPLAYMVVLFVFSSIPVDLSAPPEDQGLFSLPQFWQNALHIPAFALLCFLWAAALYQRKRALGRSLLLAIGITIAYGIFDEVHQYYVPGRFMGLMDVGLDGLGALVGASGYFGFRKWRGGS